MDEGMMNQLRLFVPIPSSNDLQFAQDVADELRQTIYIKMHSERWYIGNTPDLPVAGCQVITTIEPRRSQNDYH